MMHNLVKKTWVKFPLVLLMLVSFANMSFRMKETGEVILSSGTFIPLETIGLISSEGLQPGQTIDLKVRTDVKVNNVVVIAGGSIAKAQVTKVSEPKALGKQGIIELQVKSVQAVDGQTINLSSGSFGKEGQDRLGVSIGLGVFVCLLFLLMKGKNAEIAPGYQVEAVVASTTTINLK
jgi:hypothetical protein